MLCELSTLEKGMSKRLVRPPDLLILWTYALVGCHLLLILLGFILAFSSLKCRRQYLCIRSTFSIAILNRACSFRMVKESIRPKFCL